MRIKATWFIPGLLLTLLLGLLWALPTSAATGVVSATSDMAGKKGIDYVMPGKTIYIQVVDSDEDVVVKHDGTNRLELGANPVPFADNPLTVQQIVDVSGDGRISAADFKFFVNEEGADLGTDTAITVPTDLVNLVTDVVSLPGTGYAEFQYHAVNTLGGRDIGADYEEERALADGTTTINATVLFPGSPYPNAVLTDIVPVSTEQDDGTFNFNASVMAYNVKSTSDANPRDVELTVAVTVDGDTDSNGQIDEGETVTIASITLANAVDSGGTVLDGGTIGRKGDGQDATMPVPVRFEFDLMPSCAGDCKDGVAQSTVEVDAGNGSLPVVLFETGVNTGIFQATINTTPCDSNDDTEDIGDCSAPMQMPTTAEDTVANGRRIDGSGTGIITVPLEADGSVEVMYKDASPRGNRRLSIPADSTGPNFDNYMPASGTTGQGDRHTYSVEVSDRQSGITADDSQSNDDNGVIVMVWAADGDNSLREVVLRETFDEDAIDGGYAISHLIGSSDLDKPRGGDYDIHFWALARDKAGNWSATDTMPTKKDGDEDVADTCVVPAGFVTDAGVVGDVADLAGAKCDPHIVSVDNMGPTLNNAEAGAHLNSDGKHTLGKRTSVGVQFSENLDCGTVSASDFEVGGATPSAAECKDAWAYLTVDELAPDAEPKVELVGSVDDAAGNSQDEGDAIAVDKNKAAISVTVAGTYDSGRAVTKDKITVSASSDETLSQAPEATIYMVNADMTATPVSGLQNRRLSSKGTNQWSSDFSVPNAGLYVVAVEGTDRGSGEMTTVGKVDTTKVDLKSESLMFFEVDKSLAAPKFTPESGTSTDNPNVFIRLDYSDEGTEYLRDSDDNNKLTSDQDTHGTVWLTKATFDGGNYDNADVLDMISTRDNVKFLFNPGDLAIDEYRLTVEAKDNAGNTETSTLDFNVTARQAYTIGLNAGANLISFPAALEDGAVDAVFADAAITQVLTYDNAMGLWMTATRGQDGMFVGDLMMVDNHHAYWVIADTPADVSAMLPRGGAFSTFPPAIEVYQGWNLVPIANVDQMSAGSAMLAQDYFANIDWEVAYGYSEGQYQRIEKGAASLTLDDAEAGHKVMTGSGYFVYVNEAGVIIP